MTIIHSLDPTLISRYLQQKLGKQFAEYQHEMYRDPGQLAQKIGSTSLFAQTNAPTKMIVHNCTFLSDSSEANKALTLFDVLITENKAPVYLLVTAEKLLTKHAEVAKLLPLVNVVYLPKLTDYNMHELAEQMLNEADIKLSPEAFAHFCARMVPDAGVLEHEVAKLKLFSPAERTPQLLDDLICDYGNASVFKLLEYALVNQTTKLCNLYDRLVPQSLRPFDVLYILCGQLLNVAFASRTNPKAPIHVSAQALGVSPYALRASLRLSSLLRPKQLDQALENALNLDLRIKNYNLDEFNSIRLFLCRRLTL